MSNYRDENSESYVSPKWKNSKAENHTSDNSFLKEHLATLFIEQAFQAHDQTGNWRIPTSKRLEFMALFGLTEGEAAAQAYLAECWAEDETENIDKSLTAVERGEIDG